MLFLNFWIKIILTYINDTFDEITIADSQPNASNHKRPISMQISVRNFTMFQSRCAFSNGPDIITRQRDALRWNNFRFRFSPVATIHSKTIGREHRRSVDAERGHKGEKIAPLS